ncbi:gamma-glutamyl cyclotransferase, AIG2-like protein [Nitzschia inconspicua]|uniref:Putative gamma-glutamylcyclotransferase n=1 Tax=Nitzschia inconspicua TaxID=303405 RepID=A0A9K3LAU9_9STRA|nr:gamma-glutamyl cyclotransferase, AIG2-like protein [Nitzschia inconspicua]
MKSSTATPTSVPPIFVYGTLMNSQVVSVLLNRSWPPTIDDVSVQPARLYGYSRHPVKNCVFPAIVPSTNAAGFVNGMLVAENILTPAEMDMMDWYESDEYNRVTVPVNILGGDSCNKDSIMAQVYVWRDDLTSHLELDQEWSYDRFCEKDLEWYLDHTVRPCRADMERRGLTDPTS